MEEKELAIARVAERRTVDERSEFQFRLILSVAVLNPCEFIFAIIIFETDSPSFRHICSVFF